MYGATEELVRDPEVAAHDGRGLRLGDLAPTDARLAWAQRCAPVIMQPELDIARVRLVPRRGSTAVRHARAAAPLH